MKQTSNSNKLIYVAFSLVGILVVLYIATVVFFMNTYKGKEQGEEPSLEETVSEEDVVEEPILKIPTYDSNGTYTGFQDIPDNYTREQALEDGCIIWGVQGDIEKSEINWQKFLDACAKGENAFVRAINYNNGVVACDDLYYMHGMYITYKGTFVGLGGDVYVDGGPFSPSGQYTYLREVVDDSRAGIVTYYVLTDSLELTGETITKDKYADQVWYQDYLWCIFAERLGDVEESIYMTQKEVFSIKEVISANIPCIMDLEYPYSSYGTPLIPRFLVLKAIVEHQELYDRLIAWGQPVVDLFLPILLETEIDQYNRQECSFMAQVCADITGIGADVAYDDQDRENWAEKWIAIYKETLKSQE